MQGRVAVGPVPPLLSLLGGRPACHLLLTNSCRRRLPPLSASRAGMPFEPCRAAAAVAKTPPRHCDTGRAAVAGACLGLCSGRSHIPLPTADPSLPGPPAA